MKLDLKVLANETFDLTMPNGVVISIKKPSKALLIEMNKADIELLEAKGFEEVINILEDITVKIVSNNTSKTAFTAHDIEEFDIDYTLQRAIFKGYMDFINEVSKSPN